MVAEAETPIGRCGDCQFFDTRRVDGTPFNPSSPSRGRCRAPRGGGLAIGERAPEQPCSIRPVAFQPKQKPA